VRRTDEAFRFVAIPKHPADAERLQRAPLAFGRSTLPIFIGRARTFPPAPNFLNRTKTPALSDRGSPSPHLPRVQRRERKHG